MHYVIIGASRGLGSEVVKECLAKKGSFVIGVGRTAKEKIKNYESLKTVKNFEYFQTDISSSDDLNVLSGISDRLPEESVTIIFNAAITDSDMDKEGVLEHETYKAVCDVGIYGFGNTLWAFQKHLLKFGGVFVGISSQSSLLPVFYDNRIGYPSQKAFLNMALRSLRVYWPRKVKIVTVQLGHVGGRVVKNLPDWISPSYASAAKKIVGAISRKQVPSIIYMPLIQLVVVNLLSLLPDKVAVFLVRKVLAIAVKR